MKLLGLNGGVQLGCRTNTEGVPYLASQRFSPPVHLSKPYYDKHTGALLINLSCPTAGLLSGDRMIAISRFQMKRPWSLPRPGRLVLISCVPGLLKWSKNSELVMVRF